MLHVDDPIEPGAKQILLAGLAPLPWPKPPLMHSDEQRITTADSTESLIRFCKEIGPAIAIAGKINRRHSSN
ncbi:hypothetical protein [Bradyrhizobium sp. CCBAU 11386]|uniref:hypothetical protein n=1 Tax=Bradyrhizobium sp. CCBAU 11386 TaxID=1630837 RepID=UPI0023045211|nr:hypothetical protein [Bradyrhizobium sp. CCBAU 11386]